MSDHATDGRDRPAAAASSSFPQLPPGDLYAPPKIFEEARSIGPQLRSKQVQLKEPSAESVGKVHETAKKTGDTVSQADCDAIALALDMGATLVTDDYASQNIASFLGVRFMPLSKPGITKRRIWRLKCPNCGEWLKGATCPICGVRGKRTVFKQESLPAEA